MRLWGYYAWHTFWNTIKKMFRSTFLVIILAIFGFGIIFGLIGGVVGSMVEKQQSVETVESTVMIGISAFRSACLKISAEPEIPLLSASSI